MYLCQQDVGTVPSLDIGRLSLTVADIQLSSHWDSNSELTDDSSLIAEWYQVWVHPNQIM